MAPSRIAPTVLRTLTRSTGATRREKTRLLRTSANWLSGGFSRCQIGLQAARSFGQPRLIRQLGRAGRPCRPCSSHRYAYDDDTCDEACIVVEGIYWASVSYMGGLYTQQRAASIQNEWLLATPDASMAVEPPGN